MRYEVDGNGCWNWLGKLTPTGYAFISFYGKKVMAPRAVYELLVERIPADFHVHHRCKNPRCVNPEHLEALPPAEHRKMHEHLVGRPASCVHGHPFDERNTYWRKISDGRWERQCRKCKARRERERQARIRARRLSQTGSLEHSHPSLDA